MTYEILKKTTKTTTAHPGMDAHGRETVTGATPVSPEETPTKQAFSNQNATGPGEIRTPDQAIMSRLSSAQQIALSGDRAGTCATDGGRGAKPKVTKRGTLSVEAWLKACPVALSPEVERIIRGIVEGVE